MTNDGLIAALKRRREKWIDVAEGKRVKITRPPETEMGALLKVDGDRKLWAVGIEQVQRYVVGWEGYTEADLLGEGVGASDPLPFDAELWRLVCADDVELMTKVADGILNAVVGHLAAKDESAKNSPPA